MSAILIAGPSPKASTPEFVYANSAEALFEELNSNRNSVAVIPRKMDWLSTTQILDWMNRFPICWLIAAADFESEQIVEFINTGKVRALLGPGEDPEVPAKKILSELRPFRTNEKLKTLTQAMIGIQRANSIGEIEMVLNEALNPALQLAWVRILFSEQSSMQNELLKNVASFDFRIPGQRLTGKILFGREKKARFSKNEKQFLKEITDTTSLALGRLGKLDEAETLKQQWEATFDAIAHPLCITNEENLILRTNRAFSRAMGLHFRELVGQHALGAFFTDPQLQSQKIVTPYQARLTKGEGLERKDFEVICQALGFQLEGANSRLWLFQDITGQVKLERRILESSKLAELGTIASSIAHELNNPLGGMLSYLQLIRMDLDSKNPLFDDIMAMEEATLRCRDIIQNLLGFARVRGEPTLEVIDLRDAIQRAVKLIELQSRSKGIEVIIHNQERPAFVKGQVNALSQALCNLLQNSIDAVFERMHLEKQFSGKIELTLDRQESHYRLRISDNGLGITIENQIKIFTPLFSTKASDTNTGLGLTVAYAIVQDHSGSLEVFSQPGSGTTAIVQIPMTSAPDSEKLSAKVDL